ncbi:MAG: hypothetical protein P8X42_07085 [Calditrichaceae bacterium]|jgi:hypothetical protein
MSASNYLLCIVISFVFVCFAAAQDTTLTITDEGKVGIGITSPALLLHVGGGVQFEKYGNVVDTDARLILKTSGYNDPGRYGIRFSNNLLGTFEGEGLGNMNFGFYSSWGNTREYDAVISIHGKSEGTWGNVLQLTHDGTDGRISTDTGNLLLNPSDGAGRVGVGTQSAIDKFEVEGGAFTLDGAGALIAFRMRQNDSLRWTLLSAPWIGDNDLRLRNEITGTDILVFDRATNNVGIKTNSPMGALDVNGSIYQRGSQLHADYVFEPEYRLESIEEHAEFMWENRHLKAIPKATADKNGREIVEVGSHRKGIVEELEKAHIYIEQLNSRIKILEQKLENVTTHLEKYQ